MNVIAKLEDEKYNRIQNEKLKYERNVDDINIVYSVIIKLVQDGIDNIPRDPADVMAELQKVNKRLDSASKYKMLLEHYKQENN